MCIKEQIKVLLVQRISAKSEILEKDIFFSRRIKGKSAIFPPEPSLSQGGVQRLGRVCAVTYIGIHTHTHTHTHTRIHLLLCERRGRLRGVAAHRVSSREAERSSDISLSHTHTPSHAQPVCVSHRVILKRSRGRLGQLSLTHSSRHLGHSRLATNEERDLRARKSEVGRFEFLGSDGSTFREQHLETDKPKKTIQKIQIKD